MKDESTLKVIGSLRFPIDITYHGCPLNFHWEQVRSEVRVKLLAEDGELYILARSDGRVDKERAMRRRRLKKHWHRLHELQKQSITGDTLLLKIGAAKKEAGPGLFPGEN